MARVYMDSAAVGRIEFAAGKFLDTRIGPLVAGDAKRYAPKRTHHLANSIGWDVHGTTLYVYATAHYAGWVEMGHRVFHPTTGEVGPEVVAPEPFLRPALYKFRTPELPDPPATFPVAVPHKGGVTYRSLGAYFRSRVRRTKVQGTGPYLPREVVRENRRFWQRGG